MSTTQPTAVSGVLSRIMAAAPTLKPVQRRIADVVLGDPQAVVEMSVTALAEAAGVSEGSVINFCRAVGLRGFHDLRLGLARDLVAPVQIIHEDLMPGDTPAEVVRKVLRSDVLALEDTLRVLDMNAMARATELILAADRVEFYGIGSAMPVAIDAHYRMLRIGVRCSVHTDSHVQAVSASQTGPGVATITISHSGSTVETVGATRLAKAAGASTIVITNYGKSPIHAHADVVLHTAARETRFRTEAMTSRIAELSIVDALTACVALGDYERSVANMQRSLDVLAEKRL